MKHSLSRLLRLLSAVALCMCSALPAQATHLRAGEIIALRENCTSLTFTITLNIFTDSHSEVRFGNGILDFGDGVQITTPTVENTPRPDLGHDVATVSYTQQHTYSGPGRYVISYREANRNPDVLNIFNSVETQFYIETVINIDPILGCNNTPLLLVPPVDGACTGAAWMHNPGAYDLDGDSLSFELGTPKQGKDYFVNLYTPPNDRGLYSGLDYNTANEQKTGPPTFEIDPITGTITWDAPGEPGEYNIAFFIKEWRKIQGGYVLMGYVTRDMQIIVEDCNNKRPELTIPRDICVEAGTIISENILGSDPDRDAVRIEAFSATFDLLSSPATYSPSPPPLQSTQTSQARQAFRWATNCSHVKDQPYQVVLKITDQPIQGVSLVSFATWNITVVAPAPVLQLAQAGATPHSAELKWDPYTCQNAETIQIWRRAGPFNGTVESCVVGMPPSWGFTKVADVPANATSFVDNKKELSPGITYCYRIVAAFPRPQGGESYVSNEQCLAVKADVPIPTQATVDVTDVANGQITVTWLAPFEADPAQFPPPYTYEVYRSEGISGNAGETKVHMGQLSTLSLTDMGLNTKEKAYNYRIVAFDNMGGRVGSSVSASSVRLEPGAQFEKILLTWDADVPWSNQVQKYPWHLIYRGPEGASEQDMVLIDSVDVNKSSFRYIDTGQFNSVPLSTDQQYCYQIKTRGSYSNNNIAEPIENFSQIVCARPDDQVPPCAPSFSVNLSGRNCDEYVSSTPCSTSIFSNLLTWSAPAESCDQDVASYNIYVADQKGNLFYLYRANYTGTEFRDENLPSFARCYKIAAVDQSGNESSLSDMVCFDNCPHYELPNVFTPNGDACNAVFSAYNDRVVVGENETGLPCGSRNEAELRARCARFVERVSITFFNRWGESVYEYHSGGENSIYINWNGRDHAGRPLSAGVYYYSAHVVFDVVDPKEREKTIKGWVQIIY